MALHLNVTITTETMPGGTDGDNIVKTRLAPGDMDDVFFYNSGAPLQALHPADTLVDISKETFMNNVADSFKQSVSANGMTFGVPLGVAAAGGILYNKKVYAQLGLSVPKTWADFESNSEKIKAAGITPVLASFGTGSTWSSQLFVLGDEYNVQAANPTWAADYTANKAKYATTPGVMAGLGYLEEGFKKGWWQKDYATTTWPQAAKLLADGKDAQYPMLTQVVPTIAQQSPDEVNDIGFFELPGTDASKNGATIWMANAVYISKTSKHVDVAKDFLAFIASPAGADALTAAVPPAGPYLIKGAKLPDNVLPVAKDSLRTSMAETTHLRLSSSLH